jgi:glycine/D-amino acid oxidase-like deaminating enzyme
VDLRRREIARLAEEVTTTRRSSVSRPTPASLRETLFDVVVIGGGITGAAAARDAAMRGLSTLLVEKDDFAAGTSSRSSKLIHGGLRYLQTYQFGLVAESLRERERLLRLAPHLTEVKPFLYLLYRGDPETRTLLNLGLTFYDVASGAWLRRRHRMLSPRQVLEREPHLRSEDLLGAGLFHDALTDDARLTLDTVKAADRSGATVLNHAAVTGLVLENGSARGVRIADEISGEPVEVHARQVLNATGPWADVTRSLETGEPGTAAEDDGSGGLRLRPTKGVHIVLRREDFPLSTALFLRSPDDNRVVWPIPSRDGEHVYIGTTDTDYSGDLDHVAPDEADVQYLLNVANGAGGHRPRRRLVGGPAPARRATARDVGVQHPARARHHDRPHRDDHDRRRQADEQPRHGEAPRRRGREGARAEADGVGRAADARGRRRARRPGRGPPAGGGRGRPGGGRAGLGPPVRLRHAPAHHPVADRAGGTPRDRRRAHRRRDRARGAVGDVPVARRPHGPSHVAVLLGRRRRADADRRHRLRARRPARLGRRHA